MRNRIDIVIIGGGITGLTAAALLLRSEFADRMKLTLIDAGERPRYDSNSDIALRVSAIACGSAQLLDSIGAWSFVAAKRSCPYHRMRVWDEAATVDAAETLRFDAAEFGVPQLGFIVENVLLQHAILDVLDSQDVELQFQSPIRSLRANGDGYRLQFEDDRTLNADLVIGADGANSHVRKSVGIESRDWPYGQSAIVTHLRPDTPHLNTAWQRFLREGPLGLLPLPDGRISVVWSTTHAQGVWAKSASDEELGRAISAASDRVLGELVVAGSRGVFPLCARHVKQYVLPGVALIGDAAHAVHPLAGQGANLGLQDAATLAEVILTALANREWPADKPVLRRYERARKGANATMLHFMTGLNRLFATDSALLQELRTTGMRLFNRSGPIRERVVRVALGTGHR